MESRNRNTEIKINSFFDPNSVRAKEYALDMAEIYRERLTDEEFLDSILMEPEIDGATKLVIEANDKAGYLIDGLDLERRFSTDLFLGKIDYLREIANHSVFLLNESDSKRANVSSRFLNIYLYSRVNSLLETNFGPDFSSVYRLMLSSSAKEVDQTIDNLRQVPSLEHIGDTFEDRVLEHLIKTFIHDNPKILQKNIQHNFWKINQYINNRPKGNPEDTPNLDIALIKFFVNYEDSIVNSELIDYIDIDYLIAFKLIGEKVLSKVLPERDQLVFGINEEDGHYEYSTIPNPQKVIPIISYFGRKRRK